MQNRLATSLAVLTLALTGQAYANTAACPQIGEINQTRNTNVEVGGYVYEAKGPDGSQWTGDNPETEKPYDVAFVSANYKESAKAVICDYEGNGDAAIRLTLKAVNDWKPSENSSWKDAFCENSNISHCQFEYSSVTPAP